MATKKAPPTPPTKAQHRHAQKVTHRHTDGTFKEPPTTIAKADQPPKTDRKTPKRKD